MKNTTPEQLASQIDKWKWDTLQRVRGNSHSTIIGLIALEWCKNKDRTALDGAPEIQPKHIETLDTIKQKTLTKDQYEKEKHGHRNKIIPELLLLQGTKAKICVEVETTPKKYITKLDSLIYCMQHDENIEYGLLVTYDNRALQKEDKTYDERVEEYCHNLTNILNKPRHIFVKKIGKTQDKNFFCTGNYNLKFCKFTKDNEYKTQIYTL